MYGETRAAAELEIARFTEAHGAQYPKAVASLIVDQDRLLAYFDSRPPTGSAMDPLD